MRLRAKRSLKEPSRDARGYHYSNTNACGESAASKKRKQLTPNTQTLHPVLHHDC